MDQKAVDRQVDEHEASRPGPKTLAAAIVVGLCIAAYYHWAEIKSAFDFI